MQVRKMRLLRHKHGITRPELGRACALSPQRISEIELSETGWSRRLKRNCGVDSRQWPGGGRTRCALCAATLPAMERACLNLWRRAAMNYDVYHIPVNFTDAGRLFGLFEIRNAIETVLLTVPVLFACIAWLPLEPDAQNCGDYGSGRASGRVWAYRYQRRQPDPVAGLLVALAETEAASAPIEGEVQSK